MKRILKYILYRFIGKAIFPLVKLIYKPSEMMRGKLRFIGKFKVKTKDRKWFYLYNNAFYIETTIFWAGIDGFSSEKMTLSIWTHLCKSSNIIFDIGSNSGIFALIAKVYNNSSYVVAFEPQPNIFEVLKKNTEINKFNIHCENLALSDKEGEMPFYNYGPDSFTNENTTAGSLNKNWRPENQNSILVNVKELKNYIEENNIGNIDLMKIDVETFEYEVLSGYGKYLNLHQPILIMEIQGRKIGENVASLFDLTNYSIYNINEEFGLKSISELGMAEENKNYLLCPKLKLNFIENFIYN
jgi:FkbM family methyltransferase